MKHQTFIICHNKQYIIDNHKKYDYWDNFKILYVGTESSRGLGKIPNVVICNKLDNNIEEKNRTLLQYTAWYAAIHNNLIDKDTTHVAFLEYDIEWDADAKYYRDIMFNKLDSKVLVTRAMPLTRFFNNPPEYFHFLQVAMSKGIIPDRLRTYNRNWAVNTMFFMEVNTFLEYFNWLDKILGVEDWAGDNRAANSIERAFTIYAAIHGVKWDVLKQVRNLHYNSHGFYVNNKKNKMRDLGYV